MTVGRVIVEADGGARGNPGPAGYGAVVRDTDTGEVLGERSESLGVTTNNVAEYSGLIAGLAMAADLGARDVTVRMDSKLVIEQMTGRWQIRHPGLRPLAAQAAALVRQFDAVRFEWVPRDRNRHADALANRAMDAASGRDPGGAGSDEPAERLIAQADTTGSARPATRSAHGATPSSTAHAAGAWEPRTTPPTRLFLVRHGQTGFNASRRYSGRGNVALSEVGVRQAHALAERLARLAVPVTAVISSPLSRCTATAEVIRGALAGDVPLVIEPDLIECDFGAWEGLTFAEVRERWPNELTRWLGSPAVAPPAGESFRTVTMRARRFVAALRSAYPEQTVIAVSHVGPIKILLRDALAAGDAFLHRLHLDAAGISIVDSWPDGGVSVRTVNDTGHLVDM